MANVLNYFLLVSFAYSVYHVVRGRAKVNDAKQVETEDKRKKALNCPFARALANVGVQKQFGILNSFVDSSSILRTAFRTEMIKRKEADVGLVDTVIDKAISEMPEGRITLKEAAQFLTMRTVLDVLLPDLLLHSPPTLPSLSSPTTSSLLILSPSPSFSTILHAASLIDSLWSTEDPTKTSQLQSIFSPSLLSRLIPTYESQWRLVFYSLLEFFRNKKNQNQDGDKEIEESLVNGKFIKEALRLYAPVKNVKRAIKVEGESKEEIIVFPIATVMREKEIWGKDAEEFKPNREYSPEQEEKLRHVFGYGELKCVAGLKFVQDFCGAIVRKITKEFEREEEVAWNVLPTPLENVRGKYEDLYIIRTQVREN